MQNLRENDNWKRAVIVFKEESFTQKFSLIERSYEISRDSKYFQTGMISNSLLGMISNSLLGSCLDGTDDGVRLDWYIHALPEDGLEKAWTVDYCYITE